MNDNELWWMQGIGAGDPDKKPDCPYDTVTVRGVEISSRYSKLDEYDVVVKALGLVSARARQRTKSIFIDSKHTHDYTILLRGHNSEDVQWDIAQEYKRAFLNVAGGWNGLSVGEISFADGWCLAEMGEAQRP